MIVDISLLWDVFIYLYLLQGYEYGAYDMFLFLPMSNTHRYSLAFSTVHTGTA